MESTDVLRELRIRMIYVIKAGRLAAKKYNPTSEMAYIYWGKTDVARTVLDHLRKLRRGGL